MNPKTLKTLFVLLALPAASVVCGGAGGAGACHGSLSAGDTLPLPELSLPSIPDSLRTPPARASWLLLHFWDALNFGDTLRSRDSAFMEQCLADFLSVFPHADTSALPPAVDTLMRRAEADPPAFRLLFGLAGKYLYEPASPMYSEEHFIPFLEAFLRSSVPEEIEKLRPAYLLAAARKNRPGMTAADFAYTTRDGRRTTLRATPGERLLLIFYDPDCPHCTEVMDELDADTALRRQLAAGQLTVLAVYADSNRPAWDAAKAALPAGWTVGFAGSGILDEELYVLPSMPTLYLLDRNKKVILKETSPQAVSARLRFAD